MRVSVGSGGGPGRQLGSAAAELQQCHRVAAWGTTGLRLPCSGEEAGTPAPQWQEHRGSRVCGQKGEARRAAPLEGSQHIYICCLDLKGQLGVHIYSGSGRVRTGPPAPAQWPGRRTPQVFWPGVSPPDGRGTGTAWGHPSPLSFSTPASPSLPAPGTPAGPLHPRAGHSPKNTPEDGRPVKSSPGRLLALLLWLGLRHRGPWAWVAACQGPPP